jgi:glycosidase
MELLQGKQKARLWSLLVVFAMMIQVVAGGIWPALARAAADPQPDVFADQPGGKTKWVAAGSFQGWNNTSKDTQLKHLVGAFYAYSTVLDAGHYEFKLTKNDTWDGISNNGNNFAFDLGEKSKVNIYVNDDLGQARISLPNVAGLPQYVPALGADKWPRLVGTVQGAFGEPNWSPDKAGQFFVDYNFDGKLYKLQRNFPAGSYEAKVTFGPNWDENYGADGPGGSNLSLVTLDPSDVTFTLDMTKQPVGLTHDYVPADGKSDGQIKGGKIEFDSRSVTYKKPFGAIKEGEQDLTLRIAAEKDDVQIARVELTNGNGIASAFDMMKVTTVGEKDYFEAVIPKTAFKGIGIYGYKFILIDGKTKLEYGDDGARGGKGTVSEEGAVPFDLTVYDKNFQTPDWMKNGIVYQIFPDRFFDGNSDNNRAKVVDGSRGGADAANSTSKGGVKLQYFDGGVKKDPTPNQVWGNWNYLPENPNQTLPENKPYFPNAKTDGFWTNEFYGGDIQGIEKKIGYLKSLGVSVIYMNPVAWAASNHKYDATDYKHLDPMFGDPVYNKPNDPTSGLNYEKTKVASDRVFTKFAKEAKKAGIHLIVDGVFNHVGDDSIYFDRYEKYPEIGAYEYWSKVYDKVNAGMTQEQAEKEVRALFTAQVNPQTGKNYAYPEDFDFTTWFTVKNEKVKNDTGVGEHYKYEGWWGYESLPAVDAKEPQAGDSEALPGLHEWNVKGYRDNVIGHDLTGKSDKDASALMQYANSQRWEYLGANGWRLDVAPDVSAGTWQQFRKAVKSTAGRKDANDQKIDDPIILGEEWGVATRFLLGDQFDSVMNYRFRGALQSYIINGDAAQMNDALESIREDYPQEAWQVMLNLVDSHDTTRSITKYDHPTWEEEHLQNAPDASDKALKDQALTAIFQMGYPGAPTVYYGDEVGLTGTKDPDSRRTFPWERVSEGKKDTFAGTGRYAELFNAYQKAAAVRNGNDVFRTGDLKMAYANGDVIAYARKTDTAAGLVVVNRNTAAQTIEANVTGFLPDGVTLQDQLFGKAQGVVKNGKITVTIPAQSGLMMVSQQKLSVVPQVGGLTATGGNKSVALKWNVVSGATQYNVYRAAIEGGDVEKVGTVTTASFTDANVVNGTKYYYAVTAQIGTGEGALGDMVSATPAFQIQGVEITGAAQDMTIGVGKSTSEIAVAIDVPGLTDDPALAGKAATNLIARLAYYKEGTDKASAADTKLRYKEDKDGKKIYTATFEPTETGTYLYVAKVSTDNGETFKESGAKSLAANADPSDTTPPNAPVLAEIPVESNRVQLGWTLSGTDIAGLDIYRKAGDSEYAKIATLAKDATQYVDFTVSNDTAYTYKVVAFDKAYNRAASAEGTVTPKLVMVDVTLRLHLPDYTPTSDSIYIAGDFNGWNASGGELKVPSGATSRDIVEYKFKMMAGKAIQYKYTRGSWNTEAFTSHTRTANDTKDFGNWAYSSTDTNMQLTVKNQGGNQMAVDDYILRWSDMPMILTMPRITYGQDVEYSTTDSTFKLKGNVPYGVNFTINGQPLAAGAMDSLGNVELADIPLNPGLNTFVLHIEPSQDTLNLPWYTDKGRAGQATKTLTLKITRN